MNKTTFDQGPNLACPENADFKNLPPDARQEATVALANMRALLNNGNMTS